MGDDDVTIERSDRVPIAPAVASDDEEALGAGAGADAPSPATGGLFMIGVAAVMVVISYILYF